MYSHSAYVIYFVSIPFFRVSEFIALVSVSTTLFLFIQTRELSQRLHDIQDPNLDLTAFEARIDSGKSGGHEGGIEDITKPKSYLSRELSNEKLSVRFFFLFSILFYFFVFFGCMYYVQCLIHLKIDYYAISMSNLSIMVNHRFQMHHQYYFLKV